MRVAVISDIHANLAALEAVLLHLDGLAPDAVMVGGDVVNRGPHPRECLDLILDRVAYANWRVIRGNHEDYVLRAAGNLAHLAEWEQKVISHTRWTLERIADRTPVIAAWPDQTEVVAPDGSRVICVHASNKGNRIGLYSFMQEDELLEHAHAAAPVLCVGHTHVPFIRNVHGKLIVNAGAVGMPFDKNPDAAYAVMQWSPEGWTAEIMRVPYDRQTTERAYYETGYIRDGGPMVPLILQELQQSTSRLSHWHRHFEARVAAGALTVEESVREMIAGASNR